MTPEEDKRAQLLDALVWQSNYLVTGDRGAIPDDAALADKIRGLMSEAVDDDFLSFMVYEILPMKWRASYGEEYADDGDYDDDAYMFMYYLTCWKLSRAGIDIDARKRVL